MYTLALVTAGTAAYAEPVHPNDVVFDENGAVNQSLTGVPGDKNNGAIVFSTKSKGNCVACHQASDLSEIPFHGEVGPSIDGAGDRWTEAELRGIVSNAKMMFEGTVMPSFYAVKGFNRLGDRYTGKAHPTDKEVQPLLSAQDIEDLVAWLSSQKED